MRIFSSPKNSIKRDPVYADGFWILQKFLKSSDCNSDFLQISSWITVDLLTDLKGI